MSNPLIFADQFGSPSSLSSAELKRLLPAHSLSDCRGIETEHSLREWARAHGYSRARLAACLHRQNFPIESADPRNRRKP